MTVQDIDRRSFTAAWERWHRQKEEVLAAPHGFLAITGLHWLIAEPTRFEDAPGAWSSTAEGVVVELAEGEELALDGQVLCGRHEFGAIAERDSLRPAAGDAVIEVARRGGHDIVRPRHPGNALRTAFTRTPAYEPDPRWVVEGRFLPFEELRPVTVGAAVEGPEHVYDSPGQVEFELEGTVHRLTAFDGRTPGSLLALFTDRTSGVTTYAANRSVQITAPDAYGRVTIDFNRAANPPCAYTDLATCPLPPTGNRLPVAIEAGEEIPLERDGRD